MTTGASLYTSATVPSEKNKVALIAAASRTFWSRVVILFASAVIASRTANSRSPSATPGPVATVAPGQRYGPNFLVEDGFHHTDKFFVYGKIVYRDIYHRWWVTRFGWQYEGPEDHLRFSPHGTHNREEGPFRTKPP